jgi:hypothetical protein
MKALRYIDAILLMGLSIASIVITVCDYFDLFQSVSVFSNPNYLAILLVLLSVVGLHLGVAHMERLTFHDSLEGGTRRILDGFHTTATALIKGVHGANVRVFKDAGEQEHYLAQRLRDARIEICDLSWKEKLSRESALAHRIKAHRVFEAALAKAAERIPYREVYVFSDDRRRDKFRRRLDENIAGYSCRYFPDPGPVPRLQFVVIDREEVVFASSAYPCLCAIAQAELAQIFQSYFEAIWAAATPLKEANEVFEEEVRKVLTNDKTVGGDQS